MLDRIAEKAAGGERLARGEVAALLEPGIPLTRLGRWAHAARTRRTDPERVTYVVDRNINYTNVCVSGCLFCAFHRPPGHPEGYVLSREALECKIAEAVELGATQILLQGGLHPGLKIEDYTGMLRFIKATFPRIHVHGFSPPEIVHVARLAGTDAGAVIAELKAAGLDSIPGGGAEILTDASRERISPNKCTATEWLSVMETAHEQGLRTSATMMFGAGETAGERADHLLALRALQDRTGGFTAFIPWSFQPGNTRLAGLSEPGGHEYLRVLAASRLALDNFDNVQASWVTQGAGVAQTALFFGANDFGSTMIEENVVAAAGVTFRMSRAAIERQIRGAGFRPCRRDQGYNILSEGADSEGAVSEGANSEGAVSEESP